MSLCLAAAGLALEIEAASFTLSWRHTIEKTLWEEEWRVEDDMLVLARARIEGSGAGMDPSPQAQLEGGFYVWEPSLKRDSLLLRRDPHAGDWTLCATGRCSVLQEWFGADVDPVTIYPAREGNCAES
jgi:hypothetical protein